MDITGDELRTREIPITRRGYDCDVADVMLDRAADTIDKLSGVLSETGTAPVEASVAVEGPGLDAVSQLLARGQALIDDAVSLSDVETERIIAGAREEASAVVADAERRASALEAVVAANRDELEAARAELQAANEALAGGETELREGRVALESDRETFTADCERRESELMSAHETAERLHRDEIGALVAEADTVRTEVTELTARRDELNGDLVSIQERADEATSTLRSTLRAMLGRLES